MTQNSTDLKPIGLGIAGLGMAGAVMVHAAAAHPDFVLVAAADPHSAPREAFARDHNARAYADVKMLAADPAVQVIYIATPTSSTRRTPSLPRSTASTSSWKSRWR